MRAAPAPRRVLTAAAVCLLAGAAPVRAAPAAEGESFALSAATRRWKGLEGDRARRRQRAAWLSVLYDFEKEALRARKGPVAALAWYRHGRAAEGLANISGSRADFRRAVQSFLHVADCCASDSRADDALVAAAVLEWPKLEDAASARAHLERARALGGDRRGDAAALLAKLPSAKPTPAVAKAAVPAKPAPPAVQPAPVPPRAPTPTVARKAPRRDPEDEDADEAAPVPKTEKPAKTATSEPPRGAAPDPDEIRRLRETILSQTEWSISEQVGLKVRRIVVDAGHGGHDTGAIGPTGVHEADVALAVARQLATELAARGYEPILTREDDTFLPLERRAEIANRAHGDLFISVHCNAAPSRRLSGAETFYLNTASNRYAMRLAARENAGAGEGVSDLQLLLADLATRAHNVDSARLAAFVQQSLVSGPRGKGYGPVRDLGVRHALFFVLLGVRMPAVLVETDFVSNPDREKKLATPRFQQGLAKAIAGGIDRFVARRMQLAAVEKRQ